MVVGKRKGKGRRGDVRDAPIEEGWRCGGTCGVTSFPSFAPAGEGTWGLLARVTASFFAEEAVMAPPSSPLLGEEEMDGSSPTPHKEDKYDSDGKEEENTRCPPSSPSLFRSSSLSVLPLGDTRQHAKSNRRSSSLPCGEADMGKRDVAGYCSCIACNSSRRGREETQMDETGGHWATTRRRSTAVSGAVEGWCFSVAFFFCLFCFVCLC